VNAADWRRLRRISQAFFLILFLGLSILTNAHGQVAPGVALYFRFDPLTGLAALLAGRTWSIPGILFLATIIITLLFGRSWCGWFCPLGTLLEWIAPRKTRGKSLGRLEKWRLGKHLLWIAVLGGAMLGSTFYIFLDPLTLLNRAVTSALFPALRYAVLQSEAWLYRFPLLWDVLDAAHQAVIAPVFGSTPRYFSGALPVFLLLAGVIALNWIAERFWCRYLCPLGGLLGMLSKFSLLRREVETNTCTACGKCSRECPTATIDPGNNFRSDPAECTVCLDCLADCPVNAVKFRWQIPGWKPAARKEYDPNRRVVLGALAAAAGTAALAGIDPVRQHLPANLVRPPGASQASIESLCVRCGECVRVCPTQGLQPALLESGWHNLFTPCLAPRIGFCSYQCNACGQVCPSGAIPPLELTIKQSTPMGLARIDTDRCLPWAYNTPCAVCEEACPLPDKAIKVEEVQAVNALGMEVTLQRPRVVRELCIGCGVCENRCPLDGEAAVRVYSIST
jgi:polyferredoxin